MKPSTLLDEKLIKAFLGRNESAWKTKRAFHLSNKLQVNQI
jgi:hypothetical protein